MLAKADGIRTEVERNTYYLDGNIASKSQADGNEITFTMICWAEPMKSPPPEADRQKWQLRVTAMIPEAAS